MDILLVFKIFIVTLIPILIVYLLYNWNTKKKEKVITTKLIFDRYNVMDRFIKYPDPPKKIPKIYNNEGFEINPEKLNIYWNPIKKEWVFTSDITTTDKKLVKSYYRVAEINEIPYIVKITNDNNGEMDNEFLEGYDNRIHYFFYLDELVIYTLKDE